MGHFCHIFHFWGVSPIPLSMPAAMLNTMTFPMSNAILHRDSKMNKKTFIIE